MKKMLDVGIETGIHYKPIHKMSMYSKKQKLDSTDKISKEIVSIPVHQNLTEGDTDRIIKTINKIC
jgi:dTDP-4-amino-4,6-dideoxygalactose transaminase